MSGSRGGGVRLALVGCGRVAADYLRALAAVPELRLVAAVDPDEQARARACAAAEGAVGYAELGELLAAAPEALELDAAIVAAPPATHEELAIHLLSAGLHVLCEKPLATTTAAATRMMTTASKSHRQLMMASKFRYVPDVVETRNMIRDGMLGDIVWLSCGFCAPVAMEGRWNADQKLSGGGVLIDNGTHAVDVVRFLLGPVLRVFAQFGRRVQSVPVEDSVRLQLLSSGGAMADVSLSWSIDIANDYYVTVSGSRGTAQIGWHGSRYRLRGSQEWTGYGSGYDKVAAFQQQLRDFAWSVAHEGHEAMVRSEDAIDSVRVIDAAYRSARVERWVPVQAPAAELL